MHVARRCHEASDLVHVCDVYDALRTHRPYRDAWPHERVMSYLAEGAGSEFDEGMVAAFSRMMDRWAEAPALLGVDGGPSNEAASPERASPIAPGSSGETASSHEAGLPPETGSSPESAGPPESGS